MTNRGNMDSRPPTIDAYLDDLERRVYGHVCYYKMLETRTPAERKAWEIIGRLCEDPDVWATHGMPGEYKLARLAKEIAEALALWYPPQEER